MEDKTAKQWKRRIEACQREKDKLRDVWKENVAHRILKPFKDESDQDRVAVPQDWSRTRAKVANLFSAVPTVTLTPEAKRSAPAVPVFQREFNWVLRNQAKPEVVMEECLSDLVNAAGLCAAIVLYEATFDQREVPSIDTSMLPPDALPGLEIPTETIDVPVSERIVWRRISPAQLIWDVTFKGSDVNDAPFIGYQGSLSWAVGKREFKLRDEDKEKVLGGEKPEDLSDDDHDQAEDRTVNFTTIFYRAHIYDPNEKQLDKIRRVVFVEGLDNAVIDEDYQGQRYTDTGYVGVCDFPLQVCTLTYISDQFVPPSDSEVGRGMVEEQSRSRSQMLRQRESAVPARWMDTNRIGDPSIVDLLQKGEWNGFIPVNGNGQNAIGEIARAAYPPQNFQFDLVVNKDLDDSWGLSQNQMGGFQSGERSASEAKIVASSTATIAGKDRSKVVRFFLNLCKVQGGLMQLFHSPRLDEELVGPDGQQRLQSWDMVKTAGKFVYSIRQDSTVLLDSNQRIEQLMRTLNLVGKSGYVNVEPIIAEILSLCGLDPADVMTRPQPKGPEQPNLSLRLSGVEDLTNPIVIAMLLKSGQAPSEQEIQAAKLLLQDATAGLQPQVSSGPVPRAGLPPHEDWSAMERITKRPEELGG